MHSACFRHTCLVRRTNDQAAVSSFNMLPKAKRPSLPLLPLGHALRRRLVGTLSSKRLPLMADQTSRGMRKPTRRDLLLFAPRGLSFLPCFRPAAYARAVCQNGASCWEDRTAWHAPILFQNPFPAPKRALTTALSQSLQGRLQGGLGHLPLLRKPKAAFV